MSKYYTLPAGKYFVGDPCYVFSNDNHERWMNLLHEANYFDEDKKLVEFEGHKLFATQTAWGDGGYYDQYGNEFSVDAGLLGVVPEALWDISEDERKELDSLGKVVEFTVDFSCFAFDNSSGFNKDRNRFIVIGDHTIDTDPWIYDDYDPWEEDDYSLDEEE